ncbi:MAG TPA: DUF6325 family protein [Blastococcus sp.]|nr:DUF6325 family protein [Blastococcus sp.]
MTASSPLGPAELGPVELGPVEWLAIAFPGPGLDPRIAPALATLVRSGTARLMDAVMVHRDVDGRVRIAEVEDGLEEVDGEVLELLSDEDLVGLAADLEPGTTALVLVWENLWAAGFASDVRRAGGILLAHDRVPHENLERALRAAAGRQEAGV